MTLRLRTSALALAAALVLAACAAPAGTLPPDAGPAAVSVSQPLTLVSSGKQRVYRLHIPANAGGEMPLVLALHGGGGNSATMVS